MEQFDVNPHALAEEIGALLKQEEKKPEAIRMSFRQVAAYIYRGHNINGEMWHKYNKAVGAILGSRPKKKAAKKIVTPVKKPAGHTEVAVLFRDVKYKVRSSFDPGGGLHLLVTPPDAKLHYRRVDGKIRRYGDQKEKAGKDILALGRKIARLRFAERDARQLGLDLRIE